jgi:hypothetical protein
MELTNRLLELMDVKTRKSLGKKGVTYEEAEAGAHVKLHREVQNQLHSWCNRMEIKYIFAKQTQRSTLPIGWPDDTLFAKGHVLFIEIKIGKDILSTDQEVMHSELRELGFTVHVCNSYAHAIKTACDFFLI